MGYTDYFSPVGAAQFNLHQITTWINEKVISRNAS